MASAPMSKLHRRAIQKTATTFLESLDPTVSTNLYTSEIFNHANIQDINERGSRSGRVNKIVEILPMKEDKAFDAFCEALRETEQGYLALALEDNLLKLQTETSSCESVGVELSQSATVNNERVEGTGWRTDELDSRVINRLAQRLSDWKSLARELGVEEYKIERIASDHVNHQTPTEKAYQMLWHWRNTSQGRTYEALGKALIEIDQDELAKKFCKA